MAPLRPEELPYPVTTIDPESVSTSQVLNSGVTVKPSRGIGLLHRRAFMSQSPSYPTGEADVFKYFCNGRNHMWSAARGLSLNQWRTSLLSGKVRVLHSLCAEIGMPSSQPSRDDPTEPRILAGRQGCCECTTRVNTVTDRGKGRFRVRWGESG
jgi:hypothetical protein